jgi:Velvet factor
MQPARHSGIPLGFEHLLHPPEQTNQNPMERTLADPVPARSSNPSSRFRLHMRQQPIATRACAAGEKDRRPVDPPPILQMLLVDFNPDSETDQAILQNPQYVVGCLLYSVQRSPEGGEQEKLVHSSHVVEPMRKRQRDSPNRGVNFPSASNEQQLPHRRFVQILSGRTHVSPFYTPSDPDPETAPEYPRSTPTSRHSSSYGSFPCPHPHSRPDHRHHIHTDTLTMPATFFVFPDLSVRAAGTYRLRFRLMDWGITAETGKAQPILAETFSEPFRVYTSKDFPGMRGSSTLTWNLRKMGMLDLKPREGRGNGVGKGRGKGKGKEKEKEKEKKEKEKQGD